MSNIWDSQFFQDRGEGYFLRFEKDKAFVLKWLDVEWRDQDENTDAKFKSVDGKELLLKFEDESGIERGFTAKDGKNKFVRALRATGIQMGESFKVVRTGEGPVDTTYTVTKVEGGVEVAPKLPEEAPF